MLFKTFQSVEGPISKCSSMSPASFFTKGNNFKLHVVVFERILTYSLPIECHVKHHLAKQNFELIEFLKISTPSFMDSGYELFSFRGL